MQIRTRQRGNCGTLVGKSRGGTPFCRTWKNGFSKRSCSWETNCVRFGRIASLSAFVLFAGGCVVRIAYKCFLDCSLQEFFMFLEWRTAFSQNSLRLQYHSSFCSLQWAACPLHPSPSSASSTAVACGSYLAVSSKNSLFSAIYILAIDFP